MDTKTKLYDNNLVEIRKIRLILSKPAYVSMCILSLSKVFMCEFDYVYIKNKYGSNSRLLFTDTNSLMYEIKIEDFYEDFLKDKNISF